MSSSTSDAALIATLTTITIQTNRYLSIGIFLFGTLGNLLNCLALSQRALRSNPCSLLFLTSSIASLVTLIAGVAVRILAGWSIDLTDTNDWLCKFRFVILFTSRTIAFWLIALATIDRWLSSSADIRFRQWSTLKNARRGIIVIIVLSILANVQFLYCFEANPPNSLVRCFGKSTVCLIVYYLEFSFLVVFIPSSLMIIFGLMTVYNVHQAGVSRVRLGAAVVSTRSNDTNDRAQRSKKIEHQFLVMLSAQTIFVIVFSVPQATHALYMAFTLGETKQPLWNAINTFLLNLFILFTYMTNGMPFYVYTLSGGAIFRKALFDGLRDFTRKITCR